MVLQLYYDLLSQPCRSVYLFLKATGIEFEAKEVELLKGEQRNPENIKKYPYHKLPFIDDDGFVLAERSVYLFLKATGIEFEAKEVELLKGEQRNPENIKKYPYHKLPFIDDDGFVLAESVAIMSYIANRNKDKVPDHWFPHANIQQQARFEEFMSWQQMAIRTPVIELCLNTIRGRLNLGPMTNQPVDEAVLGKAKEDVQKAIKHIDEYFLQYKPFIVGDEISAADIQGMVELYQLRGAEQEELYKSNKKVSTWMKRVEDILAPHSTHANMKINDFRAKFYEAK